MLDHALREQLLRLFEGLEASYVFDVTADPGHASRGELLELLEETAACSAKIGCRITDGQGLEFRLLRNDKDTGIHFRAVPNGHEFSSLILAVLNADGKGKNLPDEATRRRIGALGGQIALTTYMSLTCTNCPDVVQALNLLALSNPRIDPYGRGRSPVPRGGCTAEYPGRAGGLPRRRADLRQPRLAGRTAGQTSRSASALRTQA